MNPGKCIFKQTGAKFLVKDHSKLRIINIFIKSDTAVTICICKRVCKYVTITFLNKNESVVKQNPYFSFE